MRDRRSEISYKRTLLPITSYDVSGKTKKNRPLILIVRLKLPGSRNNDYPMDNALRSTCWDVNVREMTEVLSHLSGLIVGEDSSTQFSLRQGEIKLTYLLDNKYPFFSRCPASLNFPIKQFRIPNSRI
jgi:hypothetical protein